MGHKAREANDEQMENGGQQGTKNTHNRRKTTHAHEGTRECGGETQKQKS